MSTQLIIGVLIIWLINNIFNKVMNLIEWKVKYEPINNKSMEDIEKYIKEDDIELENYE